MSVDHFATSLDCRLHTQLIYQQR